MASWKRVFASGLILLGPILVTLYVVYRAYAIAIGFTPAVLFDPNMLAGVIGSELARMLIIRVLQIGVSLAFLLVMAVAIGILTRTTIGDIFARSIDGLANRVPGLRVLYNASKIATETTIGEEQALQEPVKVRSWDGTHMPAFKTGHTTDDGRVVLFIPTAPNVSSGFVVEAEADRVIETDESVEEVLARVLSGGFGESENPQERTRTVPFDTSSDRSDDE